MSRMVWATSIAFFSIALLPGPATPGTQQPAAPVQFSDAAQEAGIEFHHINGASAEKYLPETMGSGALIFDYDNDGWSDIFFVNGGSFADPKAAQSAAHRLYRNKGDGTFADTTSGAGIAVSGYGMGACAADYNNDGWTDLYIAGVGSGRLYRNGGSGRFQDVTAGALTAPAVWSSSCAFADIDNDGDVDLYVVNYLEFSPGNNKYCGDPVDRVRHYCDPNVYDGVPDSLYRNNGDGTFTDISGGAGIALKSGKGLGVVFTDFDVDGWIDIYVANDLVPNFLFHNKKNGLFEEVALWAGVAVGGDGRPLSGMGTDAGDVDGDGLPDIFVTNMDRETHNLYRNLGKGLFSDVTFESGVGAATLPFVGWGAAFFDFDNDTDLDLAVANGAVLDNVTYFREGTTYPQRNLLLENDGAGRFSDAGPASGPGFALHKVSRALAIGDLDNDGDLDILVGNNGQPADLLINDGGNRNNYLLVRAVGTESNHDGIGARLKLSIGDRVLLREVKAGSSYMAQNDVRVHFGLGRASRADRLEIIWPSGRVDIFDDVEANRILTIQEGGKVLSR